MRVFVFGIGGTGARVLRSLTMILAAGTKLNPNVEIIPIIIDVDLSNADTARTVTALELYKKIREKAYRDEPNERKEFFGPKLSTLGGQKVQNGQEQVKDSFLMTFKGINTTFERYLKVNEMDKDNEEFLNLLYDNSDNPNQTELKLELSKGFKGNPNIGSVVFNDLENTDEYKYFEQAFNDPNDRIFIISSIFGGTGSSGFPQLIKLLQKSRNNNLRNAKKGAVVVMPYFAVKKDEKSAIDSLRFNSKTKAALSYYEEAIDLDAFYYLSDTAKEPYENKEGGEGQKNNAHMVELLAAMGIVHFSNTGSFGNEKYHEFGVQREDDKLEFAHFYDDSRTKVLNPMVRLGYATKLLMDFIPTQTNEAFAKGLSLASQLNSNDFYLQIKSFFKDHYKQWLGELSGNKRGGHFFEFEKDFNTFFRGKKIETGFFKKGISEKFLIQHLNKTQEDLSKKIPLNEERFMQMLITVSDECLKELGDIPSTL